MQYTTYTDYVSYNMRTYFKKSPKSEIGHCPMCLASVSRVKIKPSSSVQEDLDDGSLIGVHDFSYLFTCANCGWWTVRESWWLAEINHETDCLITGVARKWDLSGKNVPISILRKFFAHNQNSLEFKALDAGVFEKLIADCLRYEYQPCEVHHVGARGGQGDGGIDIYLIKDDTEWLVQVKRRLTDHPEPVQTIRLLNGVLLREGKYNGMVVTSANSFTKNAHSETVMRTPGAYCVKLIERGDILKMITKIPLEQPDPWKTALEDLHVYEHSLDLSEEFGALFIK